MTAAVVVADAQVLISIQSMIFVKDPYYNEPSYERHPNPKDALWYSHAQRANTLQHAILPALANPPPEFALIIRWDAWCPSMPWLIVHLVSAQVYGCNIGCGNNCTNILHDKKKHRGLIMCRS